MKPLLYQFARRMLLVLLLTVFCVSASVFYNPHVGKWINRDPAEEIGGVNLVAFLNNDSIGAIDASA